MTNTDYCLVTSRRGERPVAGKYAAKANGWESSWPVTDFSPNLPRNLPESGRWTIFYPS
jgi:hypothetical protein